MKQACRGLQVQLAYFPGMRILGNEGAIISPSYARSRASLPRPHRRLGAVTYHQDEELMKSFFSGVNPAVWAAVIKFLLANDPAGPLVPVSVCAVLVQPREGGFSSFWRQHSSTAAKLRLAVPLLRIHISDLRRTILGHICHLLHDTATHNADLVREFVPLVMLPREELLKTTSSKRLAKIVLGEEEALLHALSFMIRHHADIFKARAVAHTSSRARRTKTLLADAPRMPTPAVLPAHDHRPTLTLLVCRRLSSDVPAQNH